MTTDLNPELTSTVRKWAWDEQPGGARFVPQAKYSEDQARDEQGRWTDGGGDGGLPETRLATDDLEYELGEAQGRAWQHGEELALNAYGSMPLPVNAPDPESTTEGKAIGAKMMVSEAIAERIGVEPKVVSILINGWAATSNDDDYRAMWMQKMAAEEFGVPLSAWQQDKIDTMERTAAAFEADNLSIPNQLMSPLEAMEHENPNIHVWSAGTDQDAHEGVGRAFLRAQYDSTQSFFREQGITEVVAYRGQQMSTDVFIPRTESNPNEGHFGSNPSIPKEGDLLPGADNAMESWSLDQTTAEDFAAFSWGVVGYVERMVIPVERILSTPFTGYGCLAEGEIVVLGGAGQAEIISVERWSGGD